MKSLFSRLKNIIDKVNKRRPILYVDVLKTYWATLFKKKLLIVYQMGKVGSSSVTKSLKLQGFLYVYQIHRMNPYTMAKAMKKYFDRKPLDFILGEILYEKIIKKRKNIKIITLVREPISRNISDFFQSYKEFTGTKYSDANHSIEEIEDFFINNYKHSEPLIWFDTEINQTLDIDVYEYLFPKDIGYLSIIKENIELLIIKVEIDDSIKEKAISEFLGIEDFKLVNSNVAKEKEYGKTYRAFTQNINLPQSYLEILYNSEYMKHFYNDAEIESFKSKWYNRTHKELKLPSAIYQELLKASCRDVYDYEV